jgi:mono/diheme cytochrome c family protein
MRQVIAIASALALAGCAVQAQDAGNANAAADVESAPAAVSAAEDPAPPPPGMPQPITMAQRPDATGGEALYVKHCIMCHGPNGMGTGLLARRMEVAELERRDNLPAAYVVQAARRGIGNMPPIPRGEVSDEEMKLIAEYLADGPQE